MNSLANLRVEPCYSPYFLLFPWFLSVLSDRNFLVEANLSVFADCVWLSSGGGCGVPFETLLYTYLQGVCCCFWVFISNNCQYRNRVWWILLGIHVLPMVDS
uniref:Uncharacterized protein n=1 Tax=Rhizophora mucronata TaxID=61149 RepID=A0A2P2QST9_RHIMU